MGSVWLTDVEAISDVTDSGRCKLSTDEPKKPVRRCRRRRAFGSHRQRIYFSLIDPGHHSPGTAKRGIVAKQECNGNSTPLQTSVSKLLRHLVVLT